MASRISGDPYEWQNQMSERITHTGGHRYHPYDLADSRSSASSTPPLRLDTDSLEHLDDKSRIDSFDTFDDSIRLSRHKTYNTFDLGDPHSSVPNTPPPRLDPAPPKRIEIKPCIDDLDIQPFQPNLERMMSSEQ